MQNEIFWNKALETTKSAVRTKALIPLKTSKQYFRSSADDFFEIRKLETKHSITRSIYGPILNPFCPWDNSLEISTILNNHILILNKYPVQVGHMLLITNQWQPQNGWLDFHDWEALCEVNLDTQGLWFFNSSPLSGASQPHRHLQLLRRAKGEITCPRENWFLKFLNDQLSDSYKLTSSIIVKSNKIGSSTLCPDTLYKNYLNMSFDLGIGNPESNNKPLHPYNLLITSEWMALIRRSKEYAFGFSINALGFAGYLLSTNKSNVKWLKKNGPERLLEIVADPINFQ